jgi:GNAT superfamily N-acetyltransferase
MSSAVTLRKVETPRDFRALFEFPYHHYKTDLNFVPPLKSTRLDILDKSRNPAWEYMEGDYFLAYRGDQLVGTISAHINHRHNEFHNERVGWFGAFETINDPAVSGALLNAAADWVRAKGYPIMRGPQTLTTHEEVGCLVDGFVPNVLLMGYNYPYYGSLIEAAGLHKVMDVYSFYLNQSEAKEGGLNERLNRIAGSIMKRNKITLRAANAKSLKADFALIKDIYNSAWDKNWGFTPLTTRELDALIEGLGLIVDPRMLLFASVGDEPVGFILAVPDLNQVLKLARPSPAEPELLTLAKVLWHWKLRRVIDGVRVPLMGVKEQFRGRGVDAVLYANILQAIIDCGYYHSDSGWILETNEAMVSIAKNFGSRVYKTHRLYEKAL